MTLTRSHHALILALLCSFSSIVSAAAAPAGAQAVDEAWRKAITANDLDGIMAVYSENAVMWLPDAPEAKGREAIRKSTRPCWAPTPLQAPPSRTLTTKHPATFRWVGATSPLPYLQRAEALLLRCQVVSR